MIVKMLDISTAHITDSTAVWLTDVGVNGSSPIIVYEKAEYGWLVFVPDMWDEGRADQTPGDLLAVITYAKAIGCTWVMLDCDGERIPELPIYDWEDDSNE
jgi:hypothetical protein